MIIKWLKKLSYTRIIALSFFAVIFIGSILLSLPISSRNGEFTPYVDSLFTATSATCVTGLIAYDTYSHWSTFGQWTILILIQIGGIGLMTIISMFAIFFKRKINLHERKILMQSTGNMGFSGVVKLIKRIMIGTFIVEGVGALLLSFRFCNQMGGWNGIYYAVFHSVSAFCNAGFDLMGKDTPFSSLTGYVGDVYVNLIIISLIVIGGIGFLVWSDIVKYKLKLRQYSLHSKLVLCTTAILLFGGTILYYIFEYDGDMGKLSSGDTLLASLFMSATTRTAGFNTVDIAGLSGSGKVLTAILMFIGGSPGSTAGGIKTTTIAVIVLSIISMSRLKDGVSVFKRRIEDSMIRQAGAVVGIYFAGIAIATMIICRLENIGAGLVVIETVSAAATVGLSASVTPTLGIFSKIILIILMYGGRLGGLSFLLVIGERKPEAPLKRPVEKILIG